MWCTERLINRDRKCFHRETCRNVEGVSFFDGCRKDDYILCSWLNLLAQQGETLPEDVLLSVASASTLNFTFALVPVSWLVLELYSNILVVLYYFLVWNLKKKMQGLLMWVQLPLLHQHVWIRLLVDLQGLAPRGGGSPNSSEEKPFFGLTAGFWFYAGMHSWAFQQGALNMDVNVTSRVLYSHASPPCYTRQKDRNMLSVGAWWRLQQKQRCA